MFFIFACDFESKKRKLHRMFIQEFYINSLTIYLHSVGHCTEKLDGLGD